MLFRLGCKSVSDIVNSTSSLKHTPLKFEKHTPLFNPTAQRGGGG